MSQPFIKIHLINKNEAVLFHKRLLHSINIIIQFLGKMKMKTPNQLDSIVIRQPNTGKQYITTEMILYPPKISSEVEDLIGLILKSLIIVLEVFTLQKMNQTTEDLEAIRGIY